MVCAALSACNEVGCAVKGDNAEGRIQFNSAIEIDSKADIVVEWSYDSFATVAGRNRYPNVHGLITFEYSGCVDDNRATQFRAYQDSNKNLSLDTGEASGRHDGTSDGDASFISETIPENLDSNDWNKIDGINISIDTN